MSREPVAVPLDPQLAAIVAAIRARGGPSPFSGTPEEARERMRRAVMAGRANAAMPEIAGFEDTVARACGLAVPVRIYRPATAEHPLPTVLFFHGGGFVLGSVELMDDIGRKLCRDLRAVVVSVEYRLAPEHPFPAAHDDALAAATWMLDHVHELGGDARRAAIAGESAGANLATAAALSLRSRAGALAAQLLVVPGVDLARDLKRIAASGRDYPMLDARDLADIARLYIGTTPQRAASFPASPARAASLAGAPPAVIVVAGHDPLRDEGLAYADRLRADGVPVQVLDFPDMFHPFFGFFSMSDAARRASDAACEAFSMLLRSTGLRS
ncbi:MAG: alpha/beta hydrolase [Burkholderiaceae bacterium]